MVEVTSTSMSVGLGIWRVVIVKASSGPRYVVGCRNKVDKEKLVAGTRVALDMTTLTIMRALPREVRSLYSVWDSGVLLHWVE